VIRREAHRGDACDFVNELTHAQGDCHSSEITQSKLAIVITCATTMFFDRCDGCVTQKISNATRHASNRPSPNENRKVMPWCDEGVQCGWNISKIH